MNRLYALALCALVFPMLTVDAAAQSAQDSSMKVQSLDQEVQRDLQEQKPQLAIPLLRQIVALDATNLNAHANLGVLLFFEGDYAEAMPQMRTALQLKPDLWRIQALLGMAEKRTGDPNAAQKDLESAFANLSDKKLEKQAGLELVELDTALGQFSRALSVIANLEENLPQDPQVLFAAFEVSSQMMDQSLLDMLLAAPDSAEMHMIMGGELGRQGDHLKAIAQYRQAIRLNPHLPGLHFELGEQLRAAPDPALNAQAGDEYKAAVEANPYDERAWRRLAESSAAKGDFQTAQEDYRKALALQPRDADAETGLAIALISMNRTSDAMALLESALKDDPTNIVAHYRLSVLYRRAGRMADAQHETSEYNHYKELKDKMGQVFQQFRTQADPM